MKQYIAQKDSTNFVYPNKDLSEYDVEIFHEINDNSVSGTTSEITGTTIDETGITISFTFEWLLNGAEPFIDDDDNYKLMSVHYLPATINYYKPWFLCEFYDTTGTTVTGYTSGTESITVLPTDFGLSKFYNGNYYFEFRFIGHRSIYPVSGTLSVTGLTDYTGFLLTGVTLTSGVLFELGFSGTTECWGTMAQYSDDNINWSSGAWGSCNSPKTISVTEPVGTWYFRVAQRHNNGDIEYSNVISYTYADIVLYDIIMSSQANFTLQFSGVTDCSSMSGQYSRDQITWTTGVPTSCTSPLVIQTTSATGTWYFRMKQNCTPAGVKYSNILSYTY